MFSVEKPQVKPVVTESTPPTPRRRQVRLSRQQQLELVERYRAGVLRRELAEAYGVGAGTVSNVLKKHGANRSRGLDPSQVDEAVERYEIGESLARIAASMATTATPCVLHCSDVASSCARRAERPDEQGTPQQV